MTNSAHDPTHDEPLNDWLPVGMPDPDPDIGYYRSRTGTWWKLCPAHAVEARIRGRLLHDDEAPLTHEQALRVPWRTGCEACPGSEWLSVWHDLMADGDEYPNP